MQTPTALSRPILLRDGLESASPRALKYVRWIGLYLSFHSNWILSPFVHGRLQNLKTSEDAFGHVIASLTVKTSYKQKPKATG